MSELHPEPEIVSLLLPQSSAMVAGIDSGRLRISDAIPYRLVNYDIDAYRLRRGWPVAVPKIDIRAQTLASVTGKRVLYRPDPSTLETIADVRWIADPDTYDQSSLIWEPIQDNFGGWSWQTSVEYAPVMEEEFTYRSANTLITQPCIDFNSENSEHFWGNFSGGLDNSYGFTFAMVVSLRSDRQAAGILCPGRPTPVGSPIFEEQITGKQFNVQLKGVDLAVGMNSNPRSTHALANWMGRQAPLYLFVVVDAPKINVYISIGPGNTIMKSVNMGEVAPIPFNFVLGRSTGSLFECADMAVFEVSFYGNSLTGPEVRNEISALSGVYGSN